MPYCNRDPKRDYNFDNHPVGGLGCRVMGQGFRGSGKYPESGP